ncbi:unnamed protein product [Fraxinus pennsylvanica]|uniref:DUF642 domain-containing protein n=1 Tax=Fraxinus pennsylvanica TaxID=56036 RepID=A0AAD2EEQ5_9LAMI|nr:unnamed protein product [Fraxinus pennsylvanica]
MSNAADILHNPDFEIPPTNTTANSTSQFMLLTKFNTIPGWSFNGTVWYVSSGPNISLPANGHAVQLAENGKINQTFGATDDYRQYILTFTLTARGDDCFNNATAVNVSVPERSRAFSILGHFGKNLWETYAFYLGDWGSKRDSIKLEITGVTTNTASNITCWPIVDNFLITRHVMPRWYDDNILANGGFEVGPAFIKNSSEGILLNEEPEIFNSPMQGWSIIGIIKYIDSSHYKVPEGRAAIELVSGSPSGIQIDLTLTVGSTYSLEFMMGDANDSCVGDFIVYAQIGTTIQNFTVKSNGTGSAQKQFMTFEAEFTRLTSISITSFNETRTNDNVLCGPVIDNVIFRASVSYAEKMKQYIGVLSLLLTLLILL